MIPNQSGAITDMHVGKDEKQLLCLATCWASIHAGKTTHSYVNEKTNRTKKVNHFLHNGIKCQPGRFLIFLFFVFYFFPLTMTVNLHRNGNVIVDQHEEINFMAPFCM